ncbi:MAG: hypothetical protein PVJ85_17590 [Anaerolineae bacterium]
MNPYRLGPRRYTSPRVRALAGALLLLLAAGCSPPSAVAPDPTAAPSATPTSCAGWNCTLEGVVYVNSPSPDTRLPGARVTLSQVSHCSPTVGKQKTRAGRDGAFQFEVYLHDTDTFWFEAQADGYEPVQQSLGGFDCLYCACPPVEIVLKTP